MKTKHFFNVVFCVWVLQFFGLPTQAQPTVKIFLPGHAPFYSTPFYPMLGPGKKNTLGVMKYSQVKTDTLLQAVKNKKFTTVKMEFYKNLINGKPSQLYTTLILTGVDVYTMDVDSTLSKPRQTPEGLKYPIPFMFTFESERH